MTPVPPAPGRTTCPAGCGGAAEFLFDVADWLQAASVGGVARARMAEMVRADPRLGFGAMLRCRCCATLFARDVPSHAALGDFYRDYYGGTGYRAKIPGKLARERRRMLLLRWFTSGRRFLDVGCSVGCAVEAARRSGFTATGIDMDEASLAVARELFGANRFLCGTIADLPDGENFDLVTCCEVLEHVPDPAGFLAALARRLAPGGVLFLTTPDAAFAAARRDPLRWAEMKPPEHLTLFSRAALRRLLAAGFAWVRFLPNPKGGAQLIARRRR